MVEVVEREVYIKARPEIVFAYFTDPEKMLRWKGIAAELDPRPGGLYRVAINAHDIAHGAYLVIDPPRRVVFTWGWEGEGSSLPPGTSTVEIVLTPDGDGTLLRLRHSNLPEGAGAPHAEGWEHFLPRLVLAAGGGDPGPDPWAGAGTTGDEAASSPARRAGLS